MEEESFSNSSSQNIKNHQVPEYMKKVPEDVAQVLLDIEEFREKRKIIPYFAQYEFDNQKQKMHEFWGKSIEQFMKKYEKSCIISIEYIHQVFNFNGFQPMSLQRVIEELAQENNFSYAGNKLKLMKMLNLDTAKELKDQEKIKEYEKNQQEKQQKKAGLFQKLNIFNYFKSQKQDEEDSSMQNPQILQQITEIQEQNNFIVSKKLIVKHFKKFIEFLSNQQWYNDHFSFESDILQQASKINLNLGEVKLFLELLEKDGQVKYFGDKEIGKKIIFYDKDKKSQMNEDYFTNQSVVFQLEYNIQILEKNISKYNENLQELKNKILECKETEKAKKQQYLKEYLIIQKTIETTLNKQQTLKKNKLQVEDAITNKRVLNVLNQGVATAKQNQVDIQLMEDIKEQFEEINAQEQEMTDMYQEFNKLDQQQKEEIDLQLQQYLEEAGFPAEQNQNYAQNIVSYNNNINSQNNNASINFNNNNNNNNNANKAINNNKMDVEDPLKLLDELA
ncbi:CRAL/TRIO domain protein (macronuclear) [Tetrahymena thermophila SB210]|uniref:CRAL/TRIO domain protein n=1 Tax=Tetrahymena thermophila (strain SB210) TaxID=312017 RepID=I7LZG2_TETTS|nr:CRAL/TRIO domain protein [Tetrahymena thermophila SB210]EAR83824.2 CRAL/TRIO domain protein [Tetrahymena thermophila SB210]|eukprot:XP_001031487.2 CRAL/TRIO domain protein [Tetrahymena thermophila SB210]